MRYLLNWLSSIRPSQLREIYIWQPCPPSAHELVRELFAIVATYTTLEKVMIYFRDPAVGHVALRSPTQRYLTAEEVLLPLVSNLCNVRRHDLSSLPLDWTPAFLGRLASAWFNLTSLVLSDCAVPRCKYKCRIFYHSPNSALPCRVS